jgi:type II secretory pathway predicted ATPase ExeA
MLAPIIDDAHLMDVSALRRIRLLFEDFPKNHCLVLVAQPELLSRLKEVHALTHPGARLAMRLTKAHGREHGQDDDQSDELFRRLAAEGDE